MKSQSCACAKSSGSDVFFGVMAYSLWGLIPLYFKTVTQVGTLEILAHRVLWSFVMLLLLTCAMGRWGEMWRNMRDGKTLLLLTLGSAIIGTNWLTFIYAVNTQQVLQSSLGYFLGPLVNVLLGTLVFHERLRPLQVLSVTVAALGVLVLACKVGQMPWIALILALTGSFHALTRKLVSTDGLMSLAVETCVAVPIAATFLAYLAATHQATGNTPTLFPLLILGGPVTMVPFLCFGRAVRRLPLTTMGILLYLMPSIQFMLAVVFFGEPFSIYQLAAFACIWVAIAIYATDSYRMLLRNRSASVESFEMDPDCGLNPKTPGEHAEVALPMPDDRVGVRSEPGHP